MAAPKRILLVDDDPGLRQLLRATLSGPEFTIYETGSGDEALRLVRQLDPDLVILDVRLAPGEPDGLEVCRRLKSDPATRASRILMLSAVKPPPGQQAANGTSPDAYLTKPFSPRALLQYIDDLLGT